MADWTLHPQLDRDTASLGDLPLSRVLVINDANYPVAAAGAAPAGHHRGDRSRRGRADAADERGRRASRARCATVTECDKLNIAALGNVVPQLHVHVIARFRNDRRVAEAGVGRGAAARL